MVESIGRNNAPFLTAFADAVVRGIQGRRLASTPIDARVLSVDYKTGAIELDRGASDGLREGMYLYKLKDGRMRTYVTDDYDPVATWLVVQVEPHTADAKHVRNVRLNGLVAARDNVTTRVWQTPPAD